MAEDIQRFGVLVLVIALLFGSGEATGNLVFNVQHRYGGRGNSNLAVFKAHDAKRHQRFLATIDLPLGGDGQVTGSGLYFTRLSIGTPPKDFYVQVDTGSDILWVNCAGCEDCIKKSPIGVGFSMYDLKASGTGKQVTCDNEMCSVFYSNAPSSCTGPNSCDYSVSYADGSTMTGFFVTDVIKFDQVTANLETNHTNGVITFGCSEKQSGRQGTSTDGVSGIVGFGQSDTSMLSQLAASGKVQKIFSHCLDSINGGGIFAIGQVVDPKFNTTPMLDDAQHYYVMLKKAEVAGEVFDIPTDSFFYSGRKTVVDSGATLAYLPPHVYDVVMGKVTAKLSNLKTHIVDPDLKCFFYEGKIEDSFPSITFHFDQKLSLEVFPNEYLINLEGNEWCFGFQRGGIQTAEGEDLVLLGDIVLSNKLVVYDAVNRSIGWIPYNCSAGIKVRDNIAGNVNPINGRRISSSSSALKTGNVLTALSMTIMATVANMIFVGRISPSRRI